MICVSGVITTNSKYTASHRGRSVIQILDLTNFVQRWFATDSTSTQVAVLLWCYDAKIATANSLIHYTLRRNTTSIMKGQFLFWLATGKCLGKKFTVL